MIGKIAANVVGWLVSAIFLLMLILVLIGGVSSARGVISTLVALLPPVILFNPIFLHRTTFAKTAGRRLLIAVGVFVALVAADLGINIAWDSVATAQADRAQAKSDKIAADAERQAALKTKAREEAETGKDLLYGLGGTRSDPEAARPHLLFAADNGDALGMVLAANYFKTYAKPGDPAKAKAWAEKAAAALAESTDGATMYELAGLYEYSDDAKHKQWLQRAADHDYCMAIGDQISEAPGDAALWTRLLTLAARPDDWVCPYLVGNQIDATHRSAHSPVYWWKVAAARGQAMAYNDIAQAYYKGDHGVAKNEWASCDWARMGAFAGVDAEAMVWTGLCYIDGSAGWPRDRGKAIFWFKKAEQIEDGAAADWLKKYPGPEVEDRERDDLTPPRRGPTGLRPSRPRPRSAPRPTSEMR